MDTAIIQLCDVDKVYEKGDRQVVALDQVNLQVRQGEFVAVWGPSGSGKSTLLNILGTLDLPTKGTYLFMGEDVTEYNDRRLSQFRAKNIGFVFQAYNLLPNLSACDNVVLPARYAAQFDLHRVRQRAVELLTMVGLGDRIDHLPSELSGGEEQRVAIARALINDPQLILADEPTGNLDSKNHQVVLDILKRLHQAGKTLIVVSHNADLMGVAERTVELRDGRVVR